MVNVNVSKHMSGPPMVALTPMQRAQADMIRQRGQRL